MCADLQLRRSEINGQEDLKYIYFHRESAKNVSWEQP